MPDKYGNPKPGEPGYEEYAARQKFSKDGSLKPGDANYDPGPNYQQEGGATPGGNFDPNRNGDWGNQAGYGDGSKFQADFNRGAGDAWDTFVGSARINPVGFNQNAGQTGPAAQGGFFGAAGPNGADQNQARGMQMGLLQQLQDQAAGKGNSLAQMQLQKGTDQNMMQAMALGQSQRGAGAAGMAKGIAQQQATIGQGMANDSAMLRLQEQMQAQNMLGQQLGQTRGQDQGWAGMGLQNNQFNAGAQQNNAQFNAGQTNTMANNNAQRSADAAQGQAKIDLELEKLRLEAAEKRSPAGMVGGLMGGMSMSDERVKQAIKPADDALFAFLDTLDAHEYEYKDPKHGKGRRISPMAQELEKSELGQQFVFDTEDGKAVDYGKGLGTMLASVAAVHKRLKKIEDK